VLEHVADAIVRAALVHAAGAHEVAGGTTMRTPLASVSAAIIAEASGLPLGLAGT